MEVENTRQENFKVERANHTSADKALPKHLQTSIDSIIEKEAFTKYEVINKPIAPNGGNFVGELYEITIKGQTKNGAKELDIFIKNSINTSEEVTSFFSIKRAYETECFVYKDLSKIFTMIQDEANVPLQERYRMIKGYDESSSEAIFMENAIKKGYKPIDRMKMVSLKFTELAMEQLAKFHGLSFAIQKKMPKYFEDNISNYSYAMELNDEWKDFATKLSSLTINLLSDGYKSKARKYGGSMESMDNLSKYITEKDSMSVLCHGDYRVCNIIVKQEDGEIKDLIPLDYQIIYYGNPVNDIIYFIYGCTDKEFRDKHLKHLIDLYYETMRKYLQYFEINVNDVLPRDKLDKDLNERIDYGLIIALQYYPFLYGPEDNPIDIHKGLDSIKFTLDPEIITRLEEMVDEVEASKLQVLKAKNWG